MLLPNSTANSMATVSMADAAVALFSLVIAVAAPLIIDPQVVLPRHLYPATLVSIFQWFVDEFDHYLLAGPPPFLHGFVWFTLIFLWPVCIANLYGILARRRWVAAATTLMAGVTMLTYFSAIFGEMLGSGRAAPKLLKFYSSFAVIAVALVLRGLYLCLHLEVPATAVESYVQKKRV